jgi:carbon storage regulator
MLALTRKNNESVVIGSSDSFERMVKVTVLDIRPGRVKLGFEANKDVPVHRWEVWEKSQAIGRPEELGENPVARLA